MKSKRIISLALALMMSFSCFTNVLAASAITDVENTKYESAVESLEVLGIINGYEDGTYRPEKEISRAEMAKLLVVSIGMEAATDVAKGNTRFADVDKNHWASGYVNVAAEYGIINGYPDGTFAPDAPVQYSEATTMAVRALGYKNVVEARGTWPINYIAKAEELRILEGIEYSKYSDNATRGNIALLLWNTLKTPTWGIKGESDGDGLEYGKCPSLMDQHFSDYSYIENVVIKNVYVKDNEVFIKLGFIDDVKLENDINFLNLTGRTVSFVLDKEENIAIQLTTSTEDEVVTGYRNDLLVDEEYKFADAAVEKVWGEATPAYNDYIVGILDEEGDIAYYTRYALKNDVIVNEIKVTDDVVKINKNEIVMDKDAIVLLDGERITTKDLVKTDIITVLEKDVYVVSRKIVKGTFDSITKTSDKYYITIDGKAYDLNDDIKAVYEVDEDREIVEKEYLKDIINDTDSKFYGKEAVVYFNYLNEIVSIEFEVIEEVEMPRFHMLTHIPATWTETFEGRVTTYIELDNVRYTVKPGVKVPTENLSGDAVYVEFDKEDRVTKIANILTSGDVFADRFIIKTFENEDGVYDDGYIGDHRVSKNTVMFRANAVLNKEDEVEEYYVEILRKADYYLEGVEFAAIAIDTEDVFEDVAYVFVWEETKDVDRKYGVADMYKKENGKDYLEIDGKEYEVEEVEVDFINSIQSYEGKIVEFVENDTIKITLSFGNVDIQNAKIVDAVSDELYSFSGDLGVYTIETAEDKFIGEAYVEEVSEGIYKFDTLDRIDYEDIALEEGDKIIENKNMFLIIKGYEE